MPAYQIKERGHILTWGILQGVNRPALLARGIEYGEI